ncbi:hypothetical protein AB0K51_31940 [Kitasatospora sp. NPDC049285]|uniref:hypothetical protein n=1 Tax=Kitasatospora sp. NPDC049285 TaxID=3157096 RepID=UPI003412CB1B
MAVAAATMVVLTAGGRTGGENSAPARKAGQVGLWLLLPLVNNRPDCGGMQQYVGSFLGLTDDFPTAEPSTVPTRTARTRA